MPRTLKSLNSNMVRVISVHHFQGQNVETVEQPTACTVAPPDLLLLAMTRNSIEVRDLKQKQADAQNGSVLFTFPTVDEVIKMCHSINGDYVATIESKPNYNNVHKSCRRNCARVYLNWNGVATLQQSKMTSKGACLGAGSECGMVQPMRARIAGRVTPPTNSGRGEAGPCLEMIELEGGKDDQIDGYNPELIACCPITGNLCISSGRSLSIFKFLVKTHDISRLKFVDFELSRLILDLKFSPKHLELCENYLLIMNNSNVNLVKLSGDCGVETGKKRKKKGEENYKNLLSDSNTTVDFEKLDNDDVILLSSIMEENSLIRRHNALINFEKSLKIVPQNFDNEETVKNLVNLSVDEDEEFRCSLLKPWYFNNKDDEEKQDGGKDWLRSKFKMAGVAFVIATQQEAFLYFFQDSDDDVDNTGQTACIAVYNFTAPIFDIVLEDYFLHALTETGLETYTLRVVHQLCQNLDKNTICPPLTEPICLVGLRPFLGVEKILISDAYLLLLANADTSPTHSVASNSSSNAAYWTLYALELPTAVSCFTDINTTAQLHRFSSMQTYRHLMNEAHMILKAALVSQRFLSATSSSVSSSKLEDGVKLTKKSRRNNDHVVEAFKTSCALLGDHFLMSQNSEEFSLSIFYYNTASVKPDEVIRRAKKIQEQSNVQVTRGLVHYSKTAILDKKETEKLQYVTQNFLEEFLRIIETHSVRELPEIFLKSRTIREFSADKLVAILRTAGTDDETKNEENRRKMALCVLYARKNDFSKAAKLLTEIGPENSTTLLTEFWEILFEKNGRKFADFSDVGALMAVNFPDEFSDFLVHLVTDRKLLNLGRVVKIFLEYLPSSGDQTAATLLMQKFLEKFFRTFSKESNDFTLRFAAEKSGAEALKLLTRTYLSQLQIFQLKTHRNEKEDEGKWKLESEHVFPKELRYRYLDRMPPFQIEITRKMREKIMENSGNFTEFTGSSNKEADIILVKLQTILCLPVTSRSLRAEVDAFLALNTELRGADAIKSLILERRDAVEFLTIKCPQCLPQFAKDRLEEPEDLRFLIASLQHKISEIRHSGINSADYPVLFFYDKILKDVIMGAATSTTPEEFANIFTKTEENYVEYVTVCRETTHAQQIKKLINATGQQLLCTLNL